MKNKFTLCFCTNIWNHHQGPVCTELARQLGPERFKMCIFQPMNHEYSSQRRHLGWDIDPPDESWIIGPPKDSCDLAEMMKLIYSADVVVIGYSIFIPREFEQNRLMQGKLTLVMGERLFKTPINSLSILRRSFWTSIIQQRKRLNRSNVFYLAQGHYVARDLNLIHACEGRILKWGYLTTVNEQPPEERHNGKIKILWCGRMLAWKRVDLLIKAVCKLKNREQIEVNIVGDGDEHERLVEMVDKGNLGNCIKFYPPVTSVEVRLLMKKADIYVFASNRHEGWGAVLNEAMAEGCAVIANEAAGSTHELIQHGKNGLIFKDGSVEDLFGCLELYIKDASLRRSLGYRAWHDMYEIWSPKIGASRLIHLIEGINNNANLPCFLNGLCSPCDTTKDTI